MTDNLFDNFIKDKLNDYPSPVPDGLWEKIVQEKDRKPVGILWWKNYRIFTLVGVAAIVLTATLFFDQAADKMPATSKNATPSLAENNQQSLEKTNTAKQNLPLNQKASEQISSVSNASSTADQISKIEGSTLKAEKDASSSSSANALLLTNSSFEKASSSKNSHYKPNSGNGKSATFNKNLLNASSYKNETLSAQKPTEENFSNTYNKSVLLSTIETNKDLDKLFANDRIIKNLKDSKLFKVDCPSARGPVRNDFYIEVYGSPDYAKKTVISSGAANTAFLQRKDSTESMRLSYTAGFRFTKSLGENILLKAGMQYSQINEKFSYRNENERKLTTVITIRTVIRSAGDTVIVRDTSTVEQIGYRVKTTYNRYRSIDVPLLMAFEWGKESLHFSATGGVILNLYSWQKGESLDTSYVPVAFNKNSGQTFKQNIGLGLYAGFSVLKKVSDRSELFLEPYFRYNISNMTENKSLFNQRFQVAGVSMGIRYKLNGSKQR